MWALGLAEEFVDSDLLNSGDWSFNEDFVSNRRSMIELN